MCGYVDRRHFVVSNISAKSISLCVYFNMLIEIWIHSIHSRKYLYVDCALNLKIGISAPNCPYPPLPWHRKHLHCNNKLWISYSFTLYPKHRIGVCILNADWLIECRCGLSKKCNLIGWKFHGFSSSKGVP